MKKWKKRHKIGPINYFNNSSLYEISPTYKTEKNDIKLHKKTKKKCKKKVKKLLLTNTLWCPLTQSINYYQLLLSVKPWEQHHRYYIVNLKVSGLNSLLVYILYKRLYCAYWWEIATLWDLTAITPFYSLERQKTFP